MAEALATFWWRGAVGRPAAAALFAAGLLAEFAEGLELFGREHLPDTNLAQCPQAQERRLCRGQLARALFDRPLVERLGVNRFVERAPGQTQTAGQQAPFLLALLPNLTQPVLLFGRQVEAPEQFAVGAAPATAPRAVVSRRVLLLRRPRRLLRAGRRRRRRGGAEEKGEGQRLPERGGPAAARVLSSCSVHLEVTPGEAALIRAAPAEEVGPEEPRSRRA
jgi:hypothetical protein